MLNIAQDLFFLIVLIICVIAKIQNIKNNQDSSKNNIFIEKYGNIIFIFIFLMFAISIFYKVSDILNGLHVDEAGALYDAICLSKYGVDRYLNKLPVYLINFGGGQSVLYAYLAAVMIKIFGINTIAFRLPAIILSLVSIICLYKVTEENCSKTEALLTAFIFAICPWNIMKSRWGLDCNLMCSLIIISIYVLAKAINSNKRYLYVLTGIFFGITLYTYIISSMVVPIILGIILLYMLIIKKVDIKNIISLAIPLIIFAIPLIMMVLYNSGIIEGARIPIFSIPKLWFYRGGEISLKNIPQNLNSIFEILFIKDFLNYNAISEFGTLYKMSIPLVIFGLIECIGKVIKDIKCREISLDFIMLITFIAELFMGLCITEPNINKLNAIYIPMIYFAGKFVYYILNNIKYASIVIIIAYCLNAGMFLNYYFTEFTNTDLYLFENNIIDASKRAEELNKDTIYVENCLNQTYIYTIIATPISPYEFNENLKTDNGTVVEYGKYKFELPQEIDEEAVYVIKNDVEKIEQLKEAGFNSEQYGEFIVLWY